MKKPAINPLYRIMQEKEVNGMLTPAGINPLYRIMQGNFETYVEEVLVKSINPLY